MTQSNTEKSFMPLTERQQWLTAQIVDTAFKIHTTLGPGLLESVYEKVFCYGLSKRDIPFSKQKRVDILYEELVIEDALRVDIFVEDSIVEDSIIIELKAQENPHPVWEAQLLSYLKLTNRRLGYILNFHVPLMKQGIKRMIL